jgi:pSer/pThr/pTyr-binding forkhead associated (FHA) protein
MTRIPLLVATKGALAKDGKRYEIPEGQGLRLGRSEECDIIIPNDNVSRVHATVQLHNDGIWVQDNNSRNGVFVSGKRVIRPKELRPGSDLEVGDHIFVLEIAEVSDDDPSVVRAMELNSQMNRKSKTMPLSWILIAAAVVLSVGLFFALSGR